MYSKKVAIVALFGLYFGLSTPIWAEPGFAPVAMAQAPNAVKQSSLKVLQLWTTAYVAVRPEARYPSIRHNLDRMIAPDLITNIKYKMNREELEACEARKLPTCRFTDRVGQGSAFVLEDGTLLAAHHNFSEGSTGLARKFSAMALDWTQRMNNFTQRGAADLEITAFKTNPLREALFFLTDASGAVVFNSAKQSYRFLRFGNLNSFRGVVDLKAGTVGIEGIDPAIESADFSGSEWVNHDSVRIQISANLPRLQSARAGCPPGSTTYVAGFAGDSTKSRAAMGARDAVNGQLAITRGVSLGAEQISMHATQWAKASTYIQEVTGQPILLTDADGTGGMSGGPILNEQGQVCGLFKAFYPSDDKIGYNARAKVFEMISFGIPLEYLTGI